MSTNRFMSRFPVRQQARTRKATRYIRNEAVVTKLCASGLLPNRHDSLPQAFASFEVETDAGKRYVIQVRGRQALELTNQVEVGMSVAYEGHFIFARQVGDTFKGGYFLASTLEVINDGEKDPYVLDLLKLAETENQAK